MKEKFTINVNNGQTIKIYINGVLATISDMVALILKNETYIISTCPITGAVEIATITV